MDHIAQHAFDRACQLARLSDRIASTGWLDEVIGDKWTREDTQVYLCRRITSRIFGIPRDASAVRLTAYASPAEGRVEVNRRLDWYFCDIDGNQDIVPESITRILWKVGSPSTIFVECEWRMTD